jgi:hypothetical protein
MYKLLLQLFVNFEPRVTEIANSLGTVVWSVIDNQGTVKAYCPGAFAGKKVFCPPVVRRDMNDVLHSFELDEVYDDYLLFKNWSFELGAGENVDTRQLPICIELY